jgi:amidase
LLARVGHVLLGDATIVPAGGLLYADDAFAHALPDVAAALAPAVQRAESLLGPAAHITLSTDGLRAWFEVFRTLQHDEIWRTHGAWVTECRPQFGPQIAARFAAVAKTDARAVAQAQRAHAQIRDRLDELLANNTVLLIPTMPDIAPLLNEPPNTAVPVRERALALLCIAGLGGLPQITLPVAQVRGCPVGVSLVAARGRDELLLQLATLIA